MKMFALAGMLLAATSRFSFAQEKAGNKDDVKGPEPQTMICAMGMEYEQRTYSAIPFLGGLSRIVIDGTATIACPGRETAKLTLKGSGIKAGLQVPSGLNPFVHKGKKLSGHFNVRVPSLLTNRQFEASYFYIGADSPIGGVECSPFLNSSGETDVVLYMPADLNISAGASLKTISLKK